MVQTTQVTRQNRTLTVDFQNPSTYFELINDGKAFVEFVFAFILSLGFRHWFRLLQINLCSAFKQLFVSKISPGGRSPLLTLLKPLQGLDEW